MSAQAKDSSESIEPEGAIDVEELIDPEPQAEGWEHDPAGPVIGYKACADPHAFAQGAELAKIAIELARFHESQKPGEFIDDARALVFQCIKAVCDSSSEKDARYERNQRRLKDNIAKRFSSKRISESRFWGKGAKALKLNLDGKNFYFEPYSEERKWNDLVKSHIARVSDEVLAKQFKDGLSFRDWLTRELGAGRSLPDCVNEHGWRYRLVVAEREWENRKKGPGWIGDLLKDWAKAVAEDWFEEWKVEFKERGVPVVDLYAIALTRKMGHKAKGRKSPNAKSGLTESAEIDESE